MRIFGGRLMSTLLFHDRITLYTEGRGGGYERHLIKAVKTEFTDSTSVSQKRTTVYIPIYGRRAIKYLTPDKRNDGDKKSFTVKAGQKLVPYDCPASYPPSDALTVRKVTSHLTGSRRVQHIKAVAYNIPIKEDSE